jgi:hypothetical protein
MRTIKGYRMTTFELTVSLAVASALTLGTLELAELVETRALQYNDAVHTQTECYKRRDFKCLEATTKFEVIK